MEYSKIWKPEYQSFLDTEKAIRERLITFKNFSNLDLTIVVSNTSFDPNIRSIHNHSESKCNLIICRVDPVSNDNYYIFYQRYEATVEFLSKTLKPILNLHPLAEQLMKLEKNSSTIWEYHDSQSWKLRLCVNPKTNPSTIPINIFKDKVIQFLSNNYSLTSKL